MIRPTPYEIASLAAQIGHVNAILNRIDSPTEVIVEMAIDLWQNAAAQIEARYPGSHRHRFEPIEPGSRFLLCHACGETATND